jgi:DNA invertase Pin-like site-specific DNA recombinase
MRKSLKSLGNSAIAVAYLRLSPRDREDARVGLDVQRAVIVAWARTHTVRIAAWAEDRDVSGSVAAVANVEDGEKGRPGLMQALVALREHGAGVLLVQRRDRLARDLYIALSIDRLVEKHGARCINADGTANGDNPADHFMRNVLDSASAYELEIIKARQNASIAIRRARGEVIGAAPYGWGTKKDYGTNGRLVDAKLYPVPAEQHVIVQMCELRKLGHSNVTIARALTDAGYRNRAGGRWDEKQVRRILLRAMSSALVAS